MNTAIIVNGECKELNDRIYHAVSDISDIMIDMYTTYHHNSEEYRNHIEKLDKLVDLIIELQNKAE